MNRPSPLQAEIDRSPVEWLAYYIAHAPHPPPDWFLPEMDPRPARDPAWRWCDNCRADSGECEGNADCEKLRTQRDARAAWDDRQKRETVLQWPGYWAEQQVTRLRDGRVKL